jgi:hypothetical protein
MKNEQENHISAAADSRSENRDDLRNPNVNQPGDRPYGDADNLYEIPRVRSDDPPIRHWWTDDEPQQDGSSSQQNG